MTNNSDKRIVPVPKKLVCSPNKYPACGDLTFWYEHESFRIATSDPEISLKLLMCGERSSDMRIYLTLPDRNIQFGPQAGQTYRSMMYRGPTSDTIWELGSLGDPLYRDTQNNNIFPYAPIRDEERYEALATGKTFKSKAQQDFAVDLISEILRRYNGNWLGACRGEEQSASVVLLPEFKALLKKGIV